MQHSTAAAGAIASRKWGEGGARGKIMVTSQTSEEKVGKRIGIK